MGNGRHFGVSIQYAAQERPRGLAEALIIGKEFLSGGPYALILGDNIFFGGGLERLLKNAQQFKKVQRLYPIRFHNLKSLVSLKSIAKTELFPLRKNQRNLSRIWRSRVYISMIVKP